MDHRVFSGCVLEARHAVFGKPHDNVVEFMRGFCYFGRELFFV